MTIEVGRKLAHYEILGTLGAGGMGVVYRAQDTRLDREVAIKVLPESFVEDEERLRRFEREAKVLASLNHPNIDMIHGIDQDGMTCYLVLELVPGESLADLLARGPLPVPEAIAACRQIAEGLEAAHEAGIVHRDVKPANVRITPEGIVKVLDFGLAKPRLESASGGNLTTADPDSFLMTQEGVVLGTPTYMSPEQARGRPVDRRADIWAFGCVLFECLTGVRAFPGSEMLEILATIQQDEPDWDKLPARTPPHVVQLLRRCLEKDPRRRLRDIGEARLALESPSASAPAAVQSLAAERPGRGAGALPWALLVVAAAVAVWSLLRPVPSHVQPERAITRFQIEVPIEKPRIFDGVTDIAVSPDGRRVAFGVRSRDEGLYVRDLDSLELRKLTKTDGQDLCFSPDGRWLAYHEESADELRRIRLDGGAPLRVAPVTEPTGLSWHPDGFLASARRWGESLGRIELETGEHAPLVPFEPEAGERHQLDPFFLPGGDVLLLAAWTGGRWEETLLVAYDLRAGTKKILPVKGTSPAYVPLGDGETGALLWTFTSTLWAQRFDPVRLELLGDPVHVFDGIQFNVGSGQAKYDVSPGGTLAYVPGGLEMDATRVVWVDRKGETAAASPESGPFESPSLSRDGKRAILVRRGPVYQVVFLDLSRPFDERRTRRLTFEDDAVMARISPDGKYVVYGSNPDGEYRLYLRAIDGDEPPRRIHERELNVRSWSSDGRKLAYHQADESGNWNLYYLSLDDGEGDLEPHELIGTRAQEYQPQISPDDRWVAYIALGDDGKFDIHVASFPDGVHQLQVTRGGASTPRWSPDGSEILYRKDDTYHAVPVATEPTFTAGTPKPLFDAKQGSLIVASYNYAIAPDGRLLSLQPLEPEEDLDRVVVVENWAVELEALLER